MPAPQLPKFADQNGAVALITALGDNFAVVENPPYIYPRYELYPLAEARTGLDDGCVAAVMDMDGTTTTTEVLCIGALETMTRRMSGLPDCADAPFLDHDRDFPHIIGNSTTKHVEYLAHTYGAGFNVSAICRHFIRAAAWTMTLGMDPRRRVEAEQALRAQGLHALTSDPAFAHLCHLLRNNHPDLDKVNEALALRCTPRLRASETADFTRIGIEIYYQRYHETLQGIEAGTTQPPPGQARFIEPMPGVGITLALIKGWLGEDASRFGEELAAHLRALGVGTEEDIVAGMRRLGRLGAWFETHPVKPTLVTSSIAAEAKIVLNEVFRVVADDALNWPLPADRRDWLHERFSDTAGVYAAIITADDSSEIRLKPHRDLYAIALHALGVTPDQFHRVVGFEDSESGTIAIRAAGISLCCALPFAMTQGHRFEAATHVCPGGLPEVLLLRNFFLPL